MTRWKARAFIGQNEIHIQDTLPLEIHERSEHEARREAKQQIAEQSIAYDRLEIEKVK